MEWVWALFGTLVLKGLAHYRVNSFSLKKIMPYYNILCFLCLDPMVKLLISALRSQGWCVTAVFDLID